MREFAWTFKIRFLGEKNYYKLSSVEILPSMSTFVAQLDARPTGDQEVTSSTPAGSVTFYSGD